MDRFSPDQIDRQLGEWLRDEATTRAPGHLVEDVFAQVPRALQEQLAEVAAVVKKPQGHGH